jgi:hypothetical protein
MFIVAAHNPSPSPQLQPWWSTMVKCLVFWRARVRFLEYGSADLITYFMASLSHIRKIFVIVRHIKGGYNPFLPYFFHSTYVSSNSMLQPTNNRWSWKGIFKYPPEHICSLLASLSHMTQCEWFTPLGRGEHNRTRAHASRERERVKPVTSLGVVWYSGVSKCGNTVVGSWLVSVRSVSQAAVISRLWTWDRW